MKQTIMKITYEQCRELMKEYKRNPSLRLGQFFCNKYNVNNDNNLFYEKDYGKCAEIIWTKYVEY